MDSDFGLLFEQLRQLSFAKMIGSPIVGGNCDCNCDCDDGNIDNY